MEHFVLLHLMLISTSRNLVSFLKEKTKKKNLTKNIFLFSEFFLHLLFFLPCPYSFLTPPILFFLMELTGKFIIQNTINIIDIYPIILKI